MTPLEYFRAIAAEYAEKADSEVLRWLDIAQSMYSAGLLAAERKALADAYLAAHLIKMGEISGSSFSGGGSGTVPMGALISEKEGELERRYASAAKSSSTGIAAACATAYGQMWDSITRAVGIGPVTRIAW